MDTAKVSQPSLEQKQAKHESEKTEGERTSAQERDTYLNTLNGLLATHAFLKERQTNERGFLQS